MKAIWNDTIIAESDNTVVIENNHYFPPSDIHVEYFKKTETQSHCPWKGDACYYSIDIDGNVNKDAAWYYPKTSHAAKPIEGYVAFWKGVTVVAS